ncbi:toprim domain-containing protein [Tropicimonas sp. IMCC6043]|uniref:DUF7146 domain-containing protein n=1 Tax=Tropicimonas sp. IMCC6043 TaxID=2510645 RepID=UPI00101D7666|nr:toprim domain-containing protein [Tropicimonas sp. IMCC6043]RYH06100.1 hypothetical protein EU800_24990 [Tropicimonas sp. IMCC6043]
MTDASSITRTLGGNWHGRYGTAPCPVCQPEGRKDQDALTLADGGNGRLLAHCKKSGCAFADILAAAGIVPGSYARPDPAVIAQREAEQRAEAEKRRRQALALWREARPIGGTVAERYLRGRGITCDLPETLRFHPACWHASARMLPAMIARVDGADRFAVHRTYLRADGGGKAGVSPDKAMLGSVKGGAVRFAEGAGPLVVAEGIETALSLRCGLLPAAGPVWAALSASGMAALRLPDTAGALVVAVDGEDAGRMAGRRVARRATAAGWSVHIADPGDGLDFNDLLQEEAA